MITRKGEQLIVKNPLTFHSDRRFKIVQFTDIHWQNGEEPDQQSADLMVRIAKAESPDLIVLTGDILSGGGCDDAADSLREVVKIVEGCGTPVGRRFSAITTTKEVRIATS